MVRDDINGEFALGGQRPGGCRYGAGRNAGEAGNVRHRFENVRHSAWLLGHRWRGLGESASKDSRVYASNVDAGVAAL